MPWYIDQSLGNVLRQAVDDFRQNYEDYIRVYREN